MAIQHIDFSQDGLRKAYIRALDGAGNEIGPFVELVGINAADLQRQIAERNLLSRNTTYKKTGKLLSYDGNITLVALRAMLLEFFLPGSYVIVGNKMTFTERVSMSAKKFALYLESDAEGEFGEAGAIGERYFNCSCVNFTNPKTSGEYVQFQATISALPKNGDVREFIFDGDGTPFNTSGDDTAPTVTSMTPANGATGVPVAANLTSTSPLTVTFSQEMNESSLANVEMWAESTGIPVALTLVSFNASTKVAVFAKPALTASAFYHLMVPKTVRNANGVYIETVAHVRFQAAA